MKKLLLSVMFFSSVVSFAASSEEYAPVATSVSWSDRAASFIPSCPCPQVKEFVMANATSLKVWMSENPVYAAMIFLALGVALDESVRYFVASEDEADLL